MKIKFSSLYLSAAGVLLHANIVLAQATPPSIWDGLYQPLPKAEKLPEVKNDYEKNTAFLSRRFLSGKWLKSSFHKISDKALLKKQHLAFQIKTKRNTRTVYGINQIKEAVREIRALNTLKRMEEANTFAEATKKAALSPFKFAKNLLEDPIDTVTGVPKGIWNYMSRMGEMATGTRSETEESAAKELIGFSAAKRKLAYKLGINVYSQNQDLQKEINRVAWTSYSGGFAIGEWLDSATSKQSVNVKIHAALRDYSPEDLRKINRKRLLQMNTTEEEVQSFLSHPHYSPQLETLLVSSLYKLHGVKGRNAFIRKAAEANSVLEAREFLSIAKLLKHYSLKKSNLESIQVSEGEILAFTGNQNLIIPLPWDYSQWTESLANNAKKWRKKFGSDYDLEILISGYFSQRAKERLETLNYTVTKSNDLRRRP